MMPRVPTRALVLFCAAGAALLLVPAATWSQQSRSRSEVEFEPVGAPAEELPARTWGHYDFSLALEVGHQQAVVRGNNDAYRSHLNYADGFRVFDFNLRGKGSDGAFFSDFHVQGSGWGGEPNNWLRWGARKKGWFDFRAVYRRSDYFWVFPGFARDEHRNDQQRRLQGYELTLRPGRPLRFWAGYTRNSGFGLALTTFQFTFDAFPLFEPLRQTYDQYRVGVGWGDARWSGVFEQGFRFFRNDRHLFLPEGLNPGNVAGDSIALAETLRLHPVRGRVPFTRLALVGRPHSTLDFAARLLYADLETDATRFETTIAQLGGQTLRITAESLADAGRPTTVADGTISWRPLSRLRLSHAFRFHQFHLASAARTQSELFAPSARASFLLEEDRRRILRSESQSNRFEGSYQLTPGLGVRAGLRTEHRDIQRVKAREGITGRDDSVGVNARSFLLGTFFRTEHGEVFFELERGGTAGVVTRVSPADTSRLRLRVRWQPMEGVKLAANGFLHDNRNARLPTAQNPEGRHSVRTRGFLVDLQLARFRRGTLHLGYRRQDITAATDVLFFAAFQPRAGRALYVANDNYAYVDVSGRLVGNLSGEVGYRVTFNTGTFPPSDPVGTCNPLLPVSCDNATGLDPLGINFGGLNHHQPHAALRHTISRNVVWKAGWRWYGYNVKQGSHSDYKAHLITTSLLLLF